METKSYLTALPFLVKSRKLFLPYFADNSLCSPEAVNPNTGESVDVDNPEVYLDFEDAVESAETNKYTGVAMRLGDGYFSITIKDCLGDRCILRHAKEILALLSSYAELCPRSDSSIQILCQGKIPGGAISRNGISFSISGLFFFTGNPIGSFSSIRDCSNEVIEICERFIWDKSFDLQDGYE